jgi:hypothetical protein
MKSLFVCLFFSFLLTFSADIAAQEVKQNATTAAKMPTKTGVSGSVPPKATPASASKPTTNVVKKAQKASKKPASKGLFDDDYDGEVGIKYIGSEPASDEELARVKEVERNAKSAKPVTTPAVSVDKVKVTETKTEAKPVEKVKTEAKSVEKVKTEAKSAEKAKIEAKSVDKVKTEAKSVEKVKTEAKSVDKVKTEAKSVDKVKTEAKSVDKVKTEAKSAEKAKITEAKPADKVKTTQANVEAKTEVQPEMKPVTKPAVKPASKPTRGARMEFDAMTIDLGTIKEDAVLERYFEFTNTGSSNLEILECRGSCGCIQPKAESTLIAAGERGRIYVKYIARNKVGPQKPVVTLTTNGSPSVIRLFIETWVEQIPGGIKDPTPVRSENN